MIRSTLLSFLIVLLALPVFGQKEQTFKGEEAKIVEVIENESKHFWARDLKAWKKTWVHEDYVNWTAITEAGVRRYQGWDAWLAEVERFFKEDPDPIKYDGNVKKYNFKFRIYDDGAWVAFEQNDEGTVTYETRVMEKHKGKWKIAMVQLFFNWSNLKTLSNNNSDE